MGLDHALIHHKHQGYVDKERCQRKVIHHRYDFRKFYFLQEYMENKYNTMNTVTHIIGKEDLEELREVAKKWLESKDKDLLGNTISNDDWLEEDMPYLLKVCDEILTNFNDGWDAIYYWCWY